MPELPEVETTRRGIEPHLKGHHVLKTSIRNPNLRWPIPEDLPETLQDTVFKAIKRRGKYLLLETERGHLIIHLGMSGSIRVSQTKEPYRKHDHFVIQLDSGKEMRLHDPRRFGAVLWWDQALATHPRLASLGPEPLNEAFTADYLLNTCKNRKASIKQHVMDSKTVVGVGNIYACESLFLAGIHPTRAAGRISAVRIEKLVNVIKTVLGLAIEQGGTTLRDFLNEEGKPGYFKQRLNVYGRSGESCVSCGQSIKQVTLGQRSTFYCGKCQR